MSYESQNCCICSAYTRRRSERGIGQAGGGKLGKYSFCTFTTKGIGSFRPDEGANPHIGQVGVVEAVEEEKIEVTCDARVVGNVITAIKRVHPYEEVAMDVYELIDW